MEFKEIKVIFSCKAFDKLFSCVAEAKGLYEVRGILLGHYYEYTYTVVDVSFPENQDKKSKVSFMINGRKETRIIEKIRKKYYLPPFPIGIWHSHVNGVETFSMRDKLSNQKFCEAFGNSISVIAVHPSITKEIKLITYSVFACGDIKSIQTSIDMNKQIPKRYMKLL